MGFLRKKSPDLTPTRLVVGLGNPGAEYKWTRHNVGFDVIDALASRHKIPLKTLQLRSQFGVGEVCGVVVAIVKPLTFMNLSGQAVVALAKKWGIAPGDILVIADDLDLPIGKIRMRGEGRSGGHNGHKSLIHSLGTTEYPRIKIGIGKGDAETISHVLSKFHPMEREEASRAVNRAADGVESWISEGLERAMNRVNTA